MNKKIILASLFISCIALPAMAGEWPSDQDAYVLANTTYNNAAISDNMDGVTEGAVNANAWYNLTPGYYLPANSATVAACPAGYYCAGGDFSVSAADQGKTVCAKDTFSTGSASQCTACTSPYGTSDATGSTSASACKKKVGFYAYGATGNLTTTAGTIETTANPGWWDLICTQDQECRAPDASVLSGNGLTFSGGWYAGQPSSQPTTTDKCTIAAGDKINGENSSLGLTHFACWQPTSFSIPLIVPSANTLNNGTTNLYYYYYTYVNASSQIVNVRQLYSTCTDLSSDGVCAPNSLSGEISLGDKITPPTWEGHTFMGYKTQAGCEGSQIIESDGTVVVSAADFGENHYFGNNVTSNNANEHTLYACWDANVTCQAGKFLAKLTSDCMPCSVGNYCPGGNFNSSSEGDNPGLNPCPNGTYSDDTGLAECKSCYEGYTTHGTGSSVKSACYKTITLNKSDGTGTLGGASDTAVGSRECEEGNACTFPDTSVLSQDGHSFVNNNESRGWGAQGCTSGKLTFTDAEVKELGPNPTLYACKAGKGITITWMGVDGGSGDKKTTTTEVTYGGDIITPAKAYVTTGQTFLGWKFQKPQSN